MYHLDLFSGKEAMTNLEPQGCNVCGQVAHDRWGRESTPCPMSCSSLTANYHCVDTVVYGQYQAPGSLHTPDTHEGHQGSVAGSVAYCHQCHSCPDYADSIQGSSVGFSHRSETWTPLHCAWHSLGNSADDSVGSSLGRTECHIAYNTDHPSASLLAFPGIVETRTCENSICATRFAPQRVCHTLCSALSYSSYPCSCPYCTKPVGMSQGKGGA